MTAAGEADQAIDGLYRSHYRELVRIAALLAGQPGPLREAGPADHARSGRVRVAGEPGPARQAARQAEQIVQDAFVALHAVWWQVGDRRAGLAYLRRSVLAGARAAARPAVPLRPAASTPAGPAGHGLAGDRLPGDCRAGDAAATGCPAAPPSGQAALMSAIAALPGGQREALILSLYAGLPMPEIAAAMNVSPGTAARHLGTAKAALAVTAKAVLAAAATGNAAPAARTAVAAPAGAATAKAPPAGAVTAKAAPADATRKLVTAETALVGAITGNPAPAAVTGKLVTAVAGPADRATWNAPPGSQPAALASRDSAGGA
ncbi:MAG TPA: sigma factor-like helix-turn-helix DNA-binding protein [Streptosporangiaceae bacterium]|nr:sigma factor-like helix-turn-helix DNA-binding protein [Streptosporangiaceae bacterium]